jgi:hypothetical protein
MVEGERYCRRCGAEVVGQTDSGDVTLPALGPFDPDRLRPPGTDPAVAPAPGTVPVWVLVVAVLVALGVGVLLGIAN